jgi:hypothetical protein
MSIHNYLGVLVEEVRRLRALQSRDSGRPETPGVNTRRLQLKVVSKIRVKGIEWGLSSQIPLPTPVLLSHSPAASSTKTSLGHLLTRF